MMDFINEAPRAMVAICMFVGGVGIGCLVVHWRLKVEVDDRNAGAIAGAEYLAKIKDMKNTDAVVGCSDGLDFEVVEVSDVGGVRSVMKFKKYRHYVDWKIMIGDIEDPIMQSE